MRDTFRRKGFDGASLADLAADTGLAKAGLYHRFPGGKLEMAEVVLTDAKVWMVEHVLDPLNAPGEARTKLIAMTKALREFYAEGSSPCLIGTLSVGEAFDHLQSRLCASLDALQQGIAFTLLQHGFSRQESARRAEDAVVRIQGSLVVSRVRADNSPFLRLMKSLPKALLSDR
ncbi:putative HTH-type transcriptional regulator YxaF [mine drainage metagenome]|uniref:Putative HTH-type transcriptional regulator YxaF n=1 Tax=mine drainage metagenome TaxID=410659 RepID=A0A1J5RSM0_9ZZZZ